MSNTNIIIPNDIVIEIFTRVPAKSLIRLRWACKYWFNLITRDRAFIKKHYLHHHTTNTYDDGDDRIISNTSIWVSTSKTVVYTMNFGDVVNNDHDDGSLVNMDCYNLPFSNLVDENFLEFCGSCNGLILLCFHTKKLHTYLLWNPCTREVKELPHEPFNRYPVKNSYGIPVLGFGYDHTIDDYKVIRILFYRSQMLNDNASSRHLTMNIGVYTLGSNSWSTKIVTDQLLTPYLRKQIQNLGVLVNGALHWLMQYGTGRTITSFDITKEELREIEGPNEEELGEIEDFNFTSEPTFNLFLTVLNECLCICQMPNFKKIYVIWMMKDYGVKDSWTKLFTINMEKVLAAPDLYMPRNYREPPFEQYYKDGGILMVFNRNERGTMIVACDLHAKARFIYSIQSVEFSERWFVNGTYIESLISLNSGMYLSLAAGSMTPTFKKQDLRGYEVKET